MDSINKQQQEKNHQDLSGSSAAEKITELAKKAGTCFLCTHIVSGQPFSTRPMSPQKIDENGTFWFLSANDSDKNEHIQQDPQVQLLFQGSSYSDFLTVSGKASISEDKAKIKELWDPILKTWFTGGIDDPRISVIKVEPQEGYYWDTKHGIMVAGLKKVIGAILGKTLDDSIEGAVVV